MEHVITSLVVFSLLSFIEIIVFFFFFLKKAEHVPPSLENRNETRGQQCLGHLCTSDPI